MESVKAEDLSDVIGVALAMVPRGVKKSYADRYDPKEQEASRQIAKAIVGAIATYLHAKANPIPANSTGLHGC